jgi:hypothetical protein
MLSTYVVYAGMTCITDGRLILFQKVSSIRISYPKSTFHLCFKFCNRNAELEWRLQAFLAWSPASHSKFKYRRVFKVCFIKTFRRSYSIYQSQLRRKTNGSLIHKKWTWVYSLCSCLLMTIYHVSYIYV